MRFSPAFLTALTLLVGCDRGPKLLEQCMQAMSALPAAAPESGEQLDTQAWDDAEAKCQELADAKSDLSAQGKERLGALATRRKAIEAVLEARKQQRQAAEQQAQAEQLRRLRARIHLQRASINDDDCRSKGLPIYGAVYTGGTYAENEAVAYGDGCVHGYPNAGSAMSNYFCCPGIRSDD
jgi:hypothetical protein